MYLSLCLDLLCKLRAGQDGHIMRPSGCLNTVVRTDQSLVARGSSKFVDVILDRLISALRRRDENRLDQAEVALAFMPRRSPVKKYHCADGAVALVPFNDTYETVTLRGDELARLVIFGKVVETSTKW